MRSPLWLERTPKYLRIVGLQPHGTTTRRIFAGARDHLFCRDMGPPARRRESGFAARLLADGRIFRDAESEDAPLRSAPYVIPAGDKQGWEAAVFDHYQAVASAIAAKVRLRAIGSEEADLVGGTTLHFGVHAGHPYAERVLETVKRVREELNAFWNEVAAYNREHPFDSEIATRVTFYFGQTLTRPQEQRRRTQDGSNDAEEQANEDAVETRAVRLGSRRVHGMRVGRVEQRRKHVVAHALRHEHGLRSRLELRVRRLHEELRERIGVRRFRIGRCVRDSGNPRFGL